MKDFIPGKWVKNTETNLYEPYSDNDLGLYNRLYEITKKLYMKIDDPSYVTKVKANHFEFNFTPDISFQEEKLKVIILYDNNILRTDILTFTNENEVPSLATIESANALAIWCKDNTYGNYLIYDEGNSLIDPA